MEKKRDLTPSEIWAMAEPARRALSIEINKDKVMINREVFKKSDQENVNLKVAKMKYKALVKNKTAYTRSLNDTFAAFKSARLPNWGGLSINSIKL